MILNVFGVKLHLNKQYIILAIAFALIIAGLIGYRIMQNKNDIIIDTKANLDSGINVKITQQKNSGEVDSEFEEKDLINVYLVGCVEKPGIVKINRGAIIKDAIDAAGGSTENADLDNINLVYKLNFNVMLHVWGKGENSDNRINGPEGSGVTITEDSGGAIVESTDVDGKININAATIDQLQILPGVGEKTALDIVIYRDKIGGFKVIEDVMNVPGIKEGRFKKIKDKICVE